MAGEPVRVATVSTGADVWIAAIGAVATVVVAAIPVLARLSRRLSDIETAAGDAVRRSPLGNGFADDIRSSLTRIEGRLVRIEVEQTEQRKDIGGLRAETRDARAEVRDERAAREAADERIAAHQVYERGRFDELAARLPHPMPSKEH